MQTMWNLLWYIYGEACFNQKTLYKWSKNGFAIMSLSWKDSQWSGNILTRKENVLGSAVCKKGHTDSTLRYERTHPYWFPWKKFNCKQYFLLPTS